MYRAPAPPQPQGLVVRALVQLDPPHRSEVRVSARLAGVSGQSAVASTEDAGWQVLEVRLPATGNPGVLQVSLSRSWRGSTVIEDAVVRVGPLEVLPAEAPP
jgi:hypothetical protein